jgi:hypothetical protein
MPIAFLRFSIHRDFHGTATAGTNQTQATSSVFATQERSAAICCDPIGPSQTTGTEGIRSVGVIDIINTPLQRGARRPYAFVTASAASSAPKKAAKAARALRCICHLAEARC